MADFKAQQRVRLNNGTNDFGFVVGNPFFVKISDGVDSLAVDANGNISTVIRTPNGDSAMDETNDAVRVNIVAGAAAGTEFAEDAAHTSGDLGKVALVVRKDTPGSNVDTDGDYATLLQDANGRLYVNIHDGGNSITVDGTVAVSSVGGTVTVAATDLDIRDITHVSDSIKVGDGTDFLAINADGSINAVVTATDLDIRNLVFATDKVDVSGSTVTVTATDLDIRNLNLTDDAVKVSGNSSPNSELNPIYVHNVDTVVSGEEVHNYDTSSAIAADATDNHDYTVTGTTFLLKSIIVAASGAMKCEIQVGPVASLVTKAVVFTSAAKPTEQINFDPPIEVPSTSTGTVRVIRRNDDNQAMDVYSTIIGNDI